MFRYLTQGGWGFVSSHAHASARMSHPPSWLVQPSDTAHRIFNGKDNSGTISCVYKTMSNYILDYLAHANSMYNPSKCCPKQTTTNPQPRCNKKGNARERRLALTLRYNKVPTQAQQSIKPPNEQPMTPKPIYKSRLTVIQVRGRFT